MANPSSPRISADVWRVAIVVILGMIMSILDTTIVNVALRDLSQDLHATLDHIQWVVTGYLLALAAVIPITGWAAKRFGARRLFLISVILFTGGSALCGLATSAGELILFRVLQGIGGGMIMPIGQIILVKKAGPANLARIMSAIGIPIVLAPVVGPTIGGLLLDYAGWRWIFYVNLPVGIAAVIAATRLLPRDTPEDAGRLDATGLGLVGVGLVAITYGLAEIGTSAFASADVLVPLLVGIALVAGFVVRAMHIERPLLDVRLYRHPAFSAASLTTFCLGAALFGSMILMPLYFQTVRGEDAVVTGLLLGPQGIGMAVAMWLGGRATERLGGGNTALIGGLVSVVSTIPFVTLGAHTSFAFLAVAMVVRGLGIGLSTMPAMTAAYRVLKPSQVNDATPQLSVLQRIGGSIGTAILTVVLQHRLLGAGRSVTAEAAGYATTFWWVLAITAVATVPTLVLRRMERQAPVVLPVADHPADARAAADAAIGAEPAVSAMVEAP